MRRAAKIAGALLALAAAFWWIAPYNIAASVPHAPGVSWLLHGYMRNAVRTWSFAAKPPPDMDLNDPALIALGAGYFETGCAPCHGAPGRLRNPRPLGMRPNPTDLAEAVPTYADRELWWIVQNGFKYTGMPAWPAHARRPDEAWALAAFLRVYPSLEAPGYQQLAYGAVDPAAPLAERLSVGFGGLDGRVAELADTCARCHGPDGLGRGGVAPVIAGQSEAYLRATLEGFALGHRPSGFMQPIAAALSPAERDRLAQAFARMPGRGGPRIEPSIEAAAELSPLAAEGAQIAARGEPADDVPSCLGCHGADRKPIFPRIAGENRRWIGRWLRLWREQALGGTQYAGLMHAAAQTLSDHEIEALAAYFSEVEPFEPEGEGAAADGS